MKTNEFINELQMNLLQIPQKELDELIYYYEDIIYGYIEDGLSEEDAINKLGNLDDIINKIKETYTDIDFKSEKKQLKREVNSFSKTFGSKNQFIDFNGIKNLNISTTSSNIHITESTDNRIKHFNSPFSKLMFYKCDDTLFIVEESKRVFSYIIQNIFYLILSLLIGFAVRQDFSKYFWIISFIIFVVLQLITSLMYIYFKTDKIFLSIPKNINLIAKGKFGNITIQDALLDKCNISFSSGNIKVINTLANSYYAKVTSGNIKIYADEFDKPFNTSSIAAFASSGNIKLVNFDADKITAKCKSGNISLRKINTHTLLETQATSGFLRVVDSVSKNVLAKNRSGTIKYQNVECHNQFDAQVTSGIIKVSNANINNINSTATSGIIRILNILGSRADYHLDLRAHSGIVRVKEHANNHLYVDQVPNKTIANKSIKANVRSGTIKVTFMN